MLQPLKPGQVQDRGEFHLPLRPSPLARRQSVLMGGGGGEIFARRPPSAALASPIFAKLLYFQFVRPPSPIPEPAPKREICTAFFLDVIASKIRRIEFYRLGLHFRTHMECLIVVLPYAHRLASLDGTLTMAAQAGLRALHRARRSRKNPRR